MDDASRILDAQLAGGQLTAEQWLPLVYEELRRLARARMGREPAGHTLQPTALVHEAWLRLGEEACFQNRSHFFSAATEAMRRILIERARRKRAVRHGGGQARLDADAVEIASPSGKEDHLIAVHEALDLLAAEDADKAELVKLHFFAGLTLEEAGAILGISERTAKRHWAYAKAWLLDAMRDPPAN